MSTVATKKSYECKNLVGQLASPRPNKFDKAVREEAALKLANEVEKWVERGDKHYSFDQSAFDDLKEFIENEIGLADDGFKFVKRFEDRLYYDGDAELVDIMDRANHYLYEAESKAVKAWVASEHIALTLKENDPVIFRSNRLGKNVAYEGTISYIDAAHARYSVHVPSEGHIKKGSGASGTIGFIANCEDVEPIEVLPEPACPFCYKHGKVTFYANVENCSDWGHCADCNNAWVVRPPVAPCGIPMPDALRKIIDELTPQETK